MLPTWKGWLFPGCKVIGGNWFAGFGFSVMGGNDCGLLPAGKLLLYG